MTQEDSITIAHRPTCPVAQPDFVPPLNPDGTVDTSAPSVCNCDIFKRIKAYLDTGEILP